MSRLKELRLHGFKSFAEPTRFVFEPGVTAIIGPNGSGKSNMADAIRWVLGEQSNRSLRTRRADDVIFAGSESRKPIGMAEVTLTFDNRAGWLPIDFEEVTIARRAYRSGDPEYLINGSRARLKDVVELLAAGRLGANELVVVGQGTVDAALSLRPEERRQLFEEAAGVKSLQVRRNEATARLNRAGENLTRMSDLVRELKPQVRRLALQAEHQEAHDRLGLRARALILEHHARRAQAIQTELGEARRRAAALAEDAETERQAQASGRQAVIDAEAGYWAAESEARAASTAWEAAREAAIRAEGRHDGLVERDLDLGAEAGRIERELADLGDQAPPDDEAGSTTSDQARATRLEAAAAEARWRAAAEQARAAAARLLAAEEALTSLRLGEANRLAEVGRRAEEAAATKARRATLEAELVALDRRHAEAVATAAEAERVHAHTGTVLASAEAADAEARDRRAALAEAAGRVSVTRAETDERLARLTAERDELERQADDGDADLVGRLRSGGWERPDALTAIPPEAAPAVAAILGDAGRALTWKPGADVVVTGAAGEAHLLAPADGQPNGRDEALAAVHAAGTMAELLDDRSAPEVFHRTVIAPDLGALLDGWRLLPAGWAAVTLAGDLADARGLVTVRGRAGNGSLATGRTMRLAELVELTGRLAGEAGEARRNEAAAQAALDAALTRVEEAAATLEAAHAAVRRAEEDRVAATAAVERIAADRERTAAELARLSALDADAPELTTDVPEIAGLEGAAEEARRAQEAADANRDAARLTWEAAVRMADEQDAAATDRRASVARHAERADQLQRALVRIGSERAVIGESIREAAAALAEARGVEAAAGERRGSSDEAREQARHALLEAERRLGGGAGRMAELDAAQQQVVADVSRLEEALAGLERERELSLEGLPEMAAEAAPPTQPPSVDTEPDPATLGEDELADELRTTRRTIQQIGSVNPFAIEEHRELSNRLTELSRQEADLRAASEATQELIDRLDTEIAQQFQAAFAAIGQRFDEYCHLLFAGGSASLELTQDAESEAPGGIEIAVRPPGKRLQRLAMLSGGERALAGVALLFAMLTVNPVPFCVLDEVDAALDEANIGRFADALRRLAESIDFVVITHNRATIETADTIYGVTMTDAAVSRVLSLRLADLPVEVEVPA